MKLLFDTNFPDDCGSISNKKTNFSDSILLNEKISTIRKDRRNRWSVGDEIEFVVNGKEIMKDNIVSVKRIKIKTVTINAEQIGQHDFPIVIINGKSLDYEALIELSFNEGFETVENFFEYFNEPLEGKLIQWLYFDTSY